MKKSAFFICLLLLSSFAALAQPAFSGTDIDRQSGLYNCQNRVLDPETGTFLQKDPVGITGGINTYIYCNDDPINLSDPTGLSFLNNAANAGAGLGDALTFGLTSYLRGGLLNVLGLGDYNVNNTSGYYISGQVTGTVASFAYSAGEVSAGTEALNVANDARNVVADAVASGSEIRVVGQTQARVDAVASDLGVDSIDSALFEPSAGANQAFTELGDEVPTVFEDVSWTQSGVDNNALFIVEGFNPAAGGSEVASYYRDVELPIFSGNAETISYSLECVANANTQIAVGSGLVAGSVLNTFNLLTSQPPVGGVPLDKAATLVGQILSDITGAMYDPVSGQFVILGTNNPAPVKGINLDYLYTALQAVYGSAVPPFVTIVPSAIITSSYTDSGISIDLGNNVLSGTFTSPFLDPTGFDTIYVRSGAVYYNGIFYQNGVNYRAGTPSAVIDPNRSLYEVVQYRNGSGGIIASYTFGLTRLANWNGSAMTFELNVRLGSVRLVTDAGGNVIQSHNCDAFGAIQ